MYVQTSHAGHRRNVYSAIYDGKLTMEREKGCGVIGDRGREKVEYVVKGDIVVSKTTIDLSSTKRRKEEIVYGKRRRVWEREKLIEDVSLNGWIRKNQASGKATLRLQLGRTERNYKGKVVQKRWGNSLTCEIFTYNNGVEAYKVYSRKKHLEVYAPSGRLHAKMVAGISMSIGGYGTQRGTMATKIAKALSGKGAGDEPSLSPLGSWWQLGRGLPEGTNPSIRIYNNKGKVIKGGEYTTERQKTGLWMVNGKPVYYMSGVQVDAKIFNTKPEDLDAMEVLAIENAQVRGAYLTKMTMERVIEQLKGTVIDEGAEGAKLIDIPEAYIPKLERAERLRILQVVCPSTGMTFTLRVPPYILTCEEGRQWGFGVQPQPTAGHPEVPNIKKRDYLPLEVET